MDLVGGKGKSFRDEKRGAKSMFLQQRPHDRVMRRDRIIESQNHELIGNGLQSGAHGRAPEQNRGERYQAADAGFQKRLHSA